MRNTKYASQNIDSKDLFSVKKSLKSDFLTQGPAVEKFEKYLSIFFKSKYAIAVNSGTSALNITLRSLGISKNDGVLVPSNTFVSSINAAKYLTDKIIITDIDPETGLMSKNNLINALKEAKKNKIKIKILINVFYAGQVQDVHDIYKICKREKILIVEDACHAIGTKYNIKKKHYYVGECRHSTLSLFSFHSIKNITTGEGGCILTNNKNIYNTCKLLRSHGIKRNISKKYPWLYDAISLSGNSRITDFQSSLGISQLKKLNKFYKKKNSLYKFYTKALIKYKDYFVPLKKNNNCNPHWHLFPILFNKNFIHMRDKLYFFLKKNNISTQINYIPLYRHSIYKKYYMNSFHNNSEFFFSRVLSLPFHTSLKIQDIKKILLFTENFFKEFKS